MKEYSKIEYSSFKGDNMTRKNKMLYDALIDYVSYFYNCSDMPDSAKLNALKIFELLQDEKIDVIDFIPVMRQMQFSLDLLAAQEKIGLTLYNNNERTSKNNEVLNLLLPTHFNCGIKQWPCNFILQGH